MSYYTQPGFYRSMLGISEIDAISSFEIDTQSIITQNLTVSSLGSGLVSSATGALQNAIIGTGLDYDSRSNTLSNQGVTSIIAGAIGPVTLSNSTGDITIDLPQNITTTSSPQFARLSNSSINSFNQIIGTQAGQNYNGPFSVIIGHQAVSASSTASQLVAVGYRALANCNGSNNTAVGSVSGYELTSGTNNVLVGSNSGRGSTPLTTGTDNIYIGTNSSPSSSSVLREVVIGSSGIGKGQDTAFIRADSGLYVSNLTTGVLKATSGLITSNATTDDLTEGKTNLYYTNARAQGAFMASTGIDITIRGNTGYISNKNITGTTGPIGPIGPTGPIGFTGYTGPIGLPGVGGTIGYYANYYSTTTQAVNLTATQITFPNNFVQNGISLDVNNNIIFNYPGTYKITTLLQVNGSNNARFNHWYRYNGVDVANSAFEDHFSSGAGQVLSTSSGLITVVAGDTLGIWGLKTAGTINITYTPGSVSPVYPASTSVNVVVSQETYTQIGPTGYTGPQSLTTTNFNVFGGVNAGVSRTTGTGNVGLGYNSLSSLTSSLNNTAVGLDSLKTLSTNNLTQNGNNTAVGYATLARCSTGFQNTAIGAFCGSTITTGKYNTLMGTSAGYNITTGDTNYCLGLNSGYSITTSCDNINIGAYTMARNVNQMTGTDGRNIAIGHYASHNLAFYPQNNISIGYNSMYNATQCSDNIIFGTNAGNSITTGGGNIAIGGSSLSTGGTLTNGQGLNIGLGLASNLYVAGNAIGNIAIGGYSNLNTSTGANNISIGRYTQALSATGCNNIVISTNGISGTPITGKGDNTAFIDARSGIYGGQYAPSLSGIVPTFTSNANGSYVGLINGLILQWVQWTGLTWGGNSNQQPTWTFPLQWPNRAIFVAVAYPSTSCGAVTMQYYNLTTTSVVVSMYNNYYLTQSGAPLFYAIGF